MQTTDWENHLWNPSRVKKYSRAAKIDENFATNQMMPKIKTVLQFIMSSIVDTLISRRAGQWKLYGIDFVIDSDIHPWLVDVNSFPGFDWSFRTAWALQYRKRLLKSMWLCLFDVVLGKSIADEKEVPDCPGWELIYHGSDVNF